MHDLEQHTRMRDRLIAANAYDPAHEHDACGVGLVVQIDGTPKREIVEMAIRALKAVWHRGAVDADGKTGDGAGIRVDVPQAFFRAQIEKTGHQPSQARICVGQMFLPRTDLSAQEKARSIIETEVVRFGFYIYGWRQPPVDPRVIGAKANAARPEIEQILFADNLGRSDEELERILFVCRRRIEKRAQEAGMSELYVCSFSPRSLVYKGMFLAEDIDSFYLDLKDPLFVSAVAIYHQRYSTNTFPQWRLAQPFRMLAHNGEINTVSGNINWMKSHEIKMISEKFGEYGEDVKPVIQAAASDSAALDNAFELLVRAGRSGPMAKTLLVPEAWSGREDVMPRRYKALYSYANSVMEPWDGPAALAIFDGRWAIAGLDRNGLRPMRYALTDDGVLAVGSETGMCPLDGEKIIRKGRVGPGGMVAVDLEEGRFYNHEELIDDLATQHPYELWLENIIDFEPRIGPGPEPRLYEDPAEFRRRQRAAGFTIEDVELILSPMAEDAKEAVGSMGDDSPLAVLSDQYRPLSHYFRQNFAQVTNPPIDPLREERVMSLRTRFKNLGNILAEDETQTNVFVLESPVLTNGMYERMLKEIGEEVALIDCTFTPPAPGSCTGEALKADIERIRSEARVAVSSGRGHIVLTDEHQGPDRAGIPMILAAGAVHSHLVAHGLRSFCSITVRSAECMDTHYFAVLVGVGATCVNAYLAQDTLCDRWSKGLFGEVSIGQVCLSYKRAIEAGLLKILSKMGISVISSYRGGYNFEALGLSRALVADYFPGMTSRISGIGLAGLEQKTAELHAAAWGTAPNVLPVGGFYRVRASGDAHAVSGDLIHLLQSACDTNSYAAYRSYANLVNERKKAIQVRDLLDFRTSNTPASLDDVQSVNEIRKRFVTPGMSLGALSPEAHGALNIAMNRIGAKSVSGEGGEVRERYKPLKNGDNANSAVKQVASGRFGVTAEYLNNCREIEIKVAQGAKPGEGGQLPGFKVTEFIAKNRHATPGVMLISPPPHHDIYSIEDLAQLIYDLKQINPEARVCVKLVSRSGVGTIAAGVAKAKADVILISGHVGGTGASPQTSIKYAGLPWEIGLAEAHQVLMLNDLRDQVTLRTDGGLRTGRDIVIAAMLGAEEYGIGTASLIAMGCIMVRQCHSNTCPVGVCTQDERLRAKFTGRPEKVISLMTFIAEEVREILGSLGFTHLDQVIGRTDLLAQTSRGSPMLDDLDLSPLMVRADAEKRIVYRPGHRNEVPDSLDESILQDAPAFFARGEKMQLDYHVRNIHRGIGTRTSSRIVRKFGMDGLPEGHLWVTLDGSAGQSLGAFGVKGLTLEVIGDANDYVGKGLSGATIILKPPSVARYRSHTNTIIGNTVLYGATSGKLFAAGQAAERFAVRNSGATAVVEGCGANGCEYMTGGTCVILGPVGENFGAGMTGGMAFVHDPNDRFSKMVNPDTVIWRPVANPHWEAVLKALIQEHATLTGSMHARSILDNWELELAAFVQVASKESLSRLEQPLELKAAE
ncbi:glutamate synthase large subunit [bacterium]|nr:glutamate synthase large subunit [bacterium]